MRVTYFQPVHTVVKCDMVSGIVVQPKTAGAAKLQVDESEVFFNAPNTKLSSSCIGCHELLLMYIKRKTTRQIE